MAELRLSAQTEADLMAIAQEGAERFGSVASLSHLAGFERLFGLLRDQPHAGQARPEYGRGVRTLSHPPHRVLYRTAAGNVFIQRILHHRRDVRRALRDDE